MLLTVPSQPSWSCQTKQNLGGSGELDLDAARADPCDLLSLACRRAELSASHEPDAERADVPCSSSTGRWRISLPLPPGQGQLDHLGDLSGRGAGKTRAVREMDPRAQVEGGGRAGDGWVAPSLETLRRARGDGVRESAASSTPRRPTAIPEWQGHPQAAGQAERGGADLLGEAIREPSGTRNSTPGRTSSPRWEGRGCLGHAAIRAASGRSGRVARHHHAAQQPVVQAILDNPATAGRPRRPTSANNASAKSFLETVTRKYSGSFLGRPPGAGRRAPGRIPGALWSWMLERPRRRRGRRGISDRRRGGPRR